MNTTFRNHKRIQDLFFHKDDILGIEIGYWEQQGSNDMQCIFHNHFLFNFERTSYDIDGNPYIYYEIPKTFFENLVRNFSLDEIEWLGFHTVTINGVTLIQYCNNTIEDVSFNKRALKKLARGNEDFIIHTHPYLHSKESDYDTAIEILTVSAYEINSYECSVINNNVIAVYAGISKYFFKRERSYDMKSYGTHWM